MTTVSLTQKEGLLCTRAGLFFVAIAVLLAAGSASAHHNMSALFDFANDRVTAHRCTLTRIDWRNHIGLVVDVKKDGIRWKPGPLKGPPPGFFRPRRQQDRRRGCAGKTVTAEASRARDVPDVRLLRRITLPVESRNGVSPELSDMR